MLIPEEIVGDAQLRRLERAFRRSGGVDEGAAYLRALLLQGRLERSRLEAAARLGYAPARAALGEEVPLADPLSLDALMGDVEARMRAARAMARRILTTPGAVRGQAPSLEQAALAIETWLACPCQAHLEAAAQAWAEVCPQYGSLPMPAMTCPGAEVVGREAVAEAVREEVAPWLLGLAG